MKNESPSNFVCNFCQVSPPQQKQKLLIFFQRSCRRDIHATMQKWKKNAYRILGPLPTQFQQLRFYPWGPGRSRLAVKSGMPKMVSQTSMEGGCFENPVPQRRGEVSIIKGVGKVGFCFWWVDNPLFVQKFWIYSWMVMFMISYYTTVKYYIYIIYI